MDRLYSSYIRLKQQEQTMKRQELQAALKEYRNQSLTDISLNSKTELLQAEYNRIVESEKHYQGFSITVELNGKFIKVTASGVRGYTLMKHYLDGADITSNPNTSNTESLVDSKYVTSEVLATIESPQSPEANIDNAELTSLNSITIAGVKISAMTTQELANEFILMEEVASEAGYTELEQEILESNWSDSLRLKMLRFLSDWIVSGDECASA